MKKVLVLLLISMIFSTPVYSQEYMMCYVFGATNPKYISNISLTNGVVDTVSPDYFEIDSQGNLITVKLDQAFVDNMHAQGIKVTPYLSNNWDKALGNAALNNIDALAGQLHAKINEYSLDGINVDIENVNHEYRDKYTLLVKTLKEKMPDKLVSTAVAANPNDWKLGWHGSYDYAELAKYSDYLLLMAYDESYYGGAAGPVASAPWVERSIIYALKYAPPEKIVLGVPFFGRYWIKGKSVGGSGITAADVEYLISEYQAVKQFDIANMSAKVAITVGANDPQVKLWGGKVLSPGEYEIWYEDMDSVRHKIGLCEKYKLKGMGSWALGQEDKAVWSVLKSSSNHFHDTIGHWGELYAAEAYKKGWLLGRSSRVFDPEGKLTRAEAVVAMLRVCGITDTKGAEPFSDTKGHWAENQIAVARKYGRVLGLGGNIFEPDRPISREELAAIISDSVNLSTAVDYHEKLFTDISEENWSHSAVMKLAQNRVLEGFEDGTFRPKELATRAQFAKILSGISGFNMSFSAKEKVIEPR